MTEALLADRHPLDAIIRADRLPHIWCPGCGIGIAMRCYATAILESGISTDEHVVVSGIGCTGRVAGYMNIDSYHTTHGRALPFATGLKLANPRLMVSFVPPISCWLARTSLWLATAGARAVSRCARLAWAHM